MPRQLVLDDGADRPIAKHYVLELGRIGRIALMRRRRKRGADSASRNVRAVEKQGAIKGSQNETADDPLKSFRTARRSLESRHGGHQVCPVQNWSRSFQLLSMTISTSLAIFSRVRSPEFEM